MGLTATSVEAMHACEQRHMLDALNFTFVSSGMTAAAKPSDVGTVTTVQSFLQANTGKSFIIYCGEEQVASMEADLKQHFEGHAVSPHIYTNAFTRDALHNDGDQVRAYIVTDEVLMRGFDYRSPETGIALLIARKLSTQRAYLQAIGRAGRNGDTGVWA